MIINLKNFAKLKNTEIEIKNFTVFAGKSSTNKSYILKLLFSIYESFDKKNLKKELVEQIQIFSTNKKKLSKFIIEVLPLFLIFFIMYFFTKNNFFSFPVMNYLLFIWIGLFLLVFSFSIYRYKRNTKIVKNINLKLLTNKIIFNYRIFKDTLQGIFKNIDSQISKEFELEIDEFKLLYKNRGFKLENKNKLLIETANNVFIETPLILEFESFLTREKYKTPYHIESLLHNLDEDFSPTTEAEDEFIDKYKELIPKLINGKIQKSQSFEFENSEGKSFNILNVSSGIKSIGLIGYLIENKAIKPNSSIFWEEPEVHLHPSWQLKLIDLFLELMGDGVKIFISTHSPYICDYLNAKSQKLNLEEQICFNLFSFEDESENRVKNTIIDRENWDLIQSELLDPLEEIGWEYL